MSTTSTTPLYDEWNRNWPTNTFEQPTFNVNDYAIKGELLTAELIFSDFDLNTSGKYEENYIKKLLADKIAEKLMLSKYIAFTKKKEAYSQEKIIYLARTFVVPSDDVQIVRQLINNG